MTLARCAMTPTATVTPLRSKELYFLPDVLSTPGCRNIANILTFVPLARCSVLTHPSPQTLGPAILLSGWRLKGRRTATTRHIPTFLDSSSVAYVHSSMSGHTTGSVIGSATSVGHSRCPGLDRRRLLANHCENGRSMDRSLVRQGALMD